MKTITTTKTIEEIRGYEANDGTFFRSEEECMKYEDSALGVIKARVKQYRVGESSIYGILDEGCEDCHVDIFTIPDSEAAQTIAQYIALESREKPVSIDEYIGKEIMVFWSYDMDYAWWKTIDELLDSIRGNYESVKKYYEEHKKE